MRSAIVSAALLVVGCKPPAAESPDPPMTAAMAESAAAKLAAFLPSAVSKFSASGPAQTQVSFPGPRIRADRSYKGGGRTLTIELVTGDVRSEMQTIAQDEEHAFLSDTPTYWRTVDLKGRRARIAEARNAATASEAYIRVGPRVAARLNVGPRARAGESAILATALDLDGIERAGVPGPSEPEPRR